jgi:hypothetical protein
MLKEDSQNHNSGKDKKIIMNLKVQVDESRRIKEILKSRMEEKEKEKQSL